MNLRENIYLVGATTHQIVGSKLPSNKQVLFYNLSDVRLSLRDSSRLVLDKVLIFWQKARIPTREVRNCVPKLESMYEEWRKLQKSACRRTEIQIQKENEFVNRFDDLFDIAHSDALDMIQIDLDKEFLIRQRQKGRPGSLIGVGLTTHKKDIERKKQIEESEKKRKRNQYELQVQFETVELDSSSDSDENLCENNNNEFEVTSEVVSEAGPSSYRARKHFITAKLVTVLDKCKVSDRDATHILMATAEALGHKVNELIINRSSIHRVREKLRKERSIQLRKVFEISLFEKAVIHWDEKMFPSLTGKDLVERLPVILSSKGCEQLLGVPKLSAGTGEKQAESVYNLLVEWDVQDLVVAVCCDTTASNTGRLKGACVLLEQFLGKDMMYLLCRHHIYELVLRCVFEEKFGSTSGPNIPLFKNFQDNWNKLDTDKFNPGIEDPHVYLVLINVKDQILEFAHNVSKEKQFREDYRELLELSIIFLGGTPIRGTSFRVPGACHYARWMAKAIYCLKMFIFRKQFNMTLAQANACRDTCIFIIFIYIKRWFRSHIATEAPYQDLLFIQSLIEYKDIDNEVSSCLLKKFIGHLWYLSSETAALAFFDLNVSIEDKKKMVDALKSADDSSENSVKRYLVSLENVYSMKSKYTYDFINIHSNKLFQRFNITTDFLDQDPEVWHTNLNYLKGIELFRNLKVVNDAAERGVKLISDYNKMLTKDEDQEQFLMQTIYDYRRRFPDAKRKILENDY